jgi:uncharacterized membrane protein
MVVAQFLDLGTFLTMVHRLGLQAEANPLVSGLAANAGVPGVIAVKVALIAFVGSVAIALAFANDPRHQRIATFVLGCAIVAGIFGGWTNVVTMGPL